MDGFNIRDAIAFRVVGVLLFFVGLIGSVLFQKFVGHAKDADLLRLVLRCGNHTHPAKSRCMPRDCG